MNARALVKSEETRARILDAALELFREKGFEQTTMREIAARTGLAVGAAYYYFRSKEALVMAFYETAQQELEPLLEVAVGSSKALEGRLRALVEAKFDYFAENRELLGALSSHVDPRHPLSPFSEATKAIRERDIGYFERALESVSMPKDLAPYLPRLLWLQQMGLMLYWVYDGSEGQSKSRTLAERSLKITAGLVRLASVPLVRPIRRILVELLEGVI